MHDRRTPGGSPLPREGAPPPAPAPAAARTALLQRPLASYYLVLVSTGLLLAIGLVMVLSASMVRAYATFGSPFTIALKQGVAILLGLVGMQVASRIPQQDLAAARDAPAARVRGADGPGAAARRSGKTVDGARRWIPLPGGFNLQPTEFAKLGLVLWGADLLVRKRKLLGEWKHLLVPLVPVVGVVISVLALLEPDMGTTIVLSRHPDRAAVGRR